MDTTKYIKDLAAAYIVFNVMYIILTFWLESSLPPSIQEYLAGELERESTPYENVLFSIAVVALIIHLVALFFIFQEKLAAKNLFLYSYLTFALLAPFFGLFIEHGISATMSGVATVIAGAIIALFLFTDSAFNKSHHNAQ